MSQILSLSHPLEIATPRLSTVERWLLAIIFIEIPIQIDTYLFYPQDKVVYGAIGGLNISVTTVCLVLLYLLRLPELLVPRDHERGMVLRASWPLWLYVGAISASLFVAYDLSKAFYYLFMVLQSFLLFLYIVRFVRDREAITFAVGMLLMGLLIESIIMIGLRIYNESFEIPFIRFRVDTEDGSRVAGTVGSPVTASTYLSLLLASALAMTVTPARRIYKWIAGLAFCLGTVALFLTIARGGIGVFALSTAALCLLCWRRRWMSIALPMVVVFAVAVVWIANAEAISERFFGEDQSSAHGRLPLIKLAFEMIADHPLWGVGANNCANVGMDYAGISSLRGEWFYTIHNKYLLVWVETGIFGLAAFCIFLLVILRRGWQGWQLRDRLLSPLALALVAAVAGQMIHMTVDIFNSRPQEQTLWAVAALITSIRLTGSEA